MTIRPSTDQDIPAIVDLLKLSLGESLMSKSEAFWRWKHIENPFGKSPVLLAFEQDELIGVRAFMRWEWRSGKTIFKSVRAVDTATHPNHQGKGIFKALTTQLVEQCRADGVHFIFNTPNKISMPGYLKMGWEKNGRMKIWVRPIMNLSRHEEKISRQRFVPDDALFFLKEWTFFPDEKLITNRSLEYLQWRYDQNPNFEYYQLQHNDALGIYRLKPNRFGNEFRIVELFWNGKNRSDLSRMIVQTAKAAGANLITYSGISFPLQAFQLPVGPIVTVHQLNGQNSLSFGFWKPSLGDMEVF